jgi:hypothetical protein
MTHNKFFNHNIFYLFQPLPTLLTLFFYSGGTTPKLLQMSNEHCLCLCMTLYVYGCYLLRLVDGMDVRLDVNVFMDDFYMLIEIIFE